MTDRDRVERCQRIARAAVAKMDTLRFGEPDESFYGALREALVTAGASEGEIDGTACLVVTRIVEATPAGSELRHEQFELIQAHLVRTAMRIGTFNNDNPQRRVSEPSESPIVLPSAVARNESYREE